MDSPSAGCDVSGTVAPEIGKELKSWDSRLARWCMSPFAKTRLQPNHITSLSLAAGLLGAASYAEGTVAAMNLGALLYALSIFLDHCDGELARLTRRMSAFGHAYDRAVDLIVKLAIFSGMGLGLGQGSMGTPAIVMGAIAGLAFVAIFMLRSRIAKLAGHMPDQPAMGGFEIEDILYLVAPITWFQLLPAFIAAASIGAPAFALFSFWQLRRTATRGA